MSRFQRQAAGFIDDEQLRSREVLDLAVKPISFSACATRSARSTAEPPSTQGAKNSVRHRLPAVLIPVLGLGRISFIRFNYRVVDPEKAAALNDKKAEAEPELIDTQAGVKLVVPQMEKVGSGNCTRAAHPSQAGRTGWPSRTAADA